MPRVKRAVHAQKKRRKVLEEALRKNNVNASGGYATRGEKEVPIRVLGRLGPDPALVVRDRS